YTLGQEFEVTERNILKIEYQDTTHYGFIFGNGLIYGFLAAYYENPNPSPWVAFTTFSRTLVSALMGGELATQMFEPFRARIRVDGEEWERQEYTAVVASTIEQIGLGFRPFIRCR